MYGAKSREGRKLITVSKLKAMEENIWLELHDSKVFLISHVLVACRCFIFFTCFRKSL